MIPDMLTLGAAERFSGPGRVRLDGAERVAARAGTPLEVNVWHGHSQDRQRFSQGGRHHIRDVGTSECRLPGVR